jgi:multidrug resistance protein, MATE family
MTLVYIPLAIVLSFSEKILIALGQDALVARYAHDYIIPMIPAMFFLGLFDLSRRFLTCLQYSQAPMVAQVVSAIMHLLICLFYVGPHDAGVQGLGIATLISYFAMYIFTEIYACCIRDISKAIFWPNKDTFTGLSEYLSISLPSIVMLVAEGWAFNVMGIFAGLISVTDQASNTILLMFVSVMFMFPMGIQSAAGALIGEQIGANQVQTAKQYFRVMVIVCLFILVSVQVTVYSLKEQIVRAFTADE